ncbi:hypothetical protein IU437_26610 [Nocardia farcinica]|nr:MULTISPECIES: hypothetical protein [Nocardia]MBF6289939.1 hypothetical protein [Nocardia cyriacigeorgica]MBF6422217.1 hypothetical protein [Nocardia farcinica]MBF6504941.1 hypothetical protein [Nocardia farcinica]
MPTVLCTTINARHVLIRSGVLHMLHVLVGFRLLTRTGALRRIYIRHSPVRGGPVIVVPLMSGSSVVGSTVVLADFLLMSAGYVVAVPGVVAARPAVVLVLATVGFGARWWRGVVTSAKTEGRGVEFCCGSFGFGDPGSVPRKRHAVENLGDVGAEFVVDRTGDDQ